MLDIACLVAWSFYDLELLAKCAMLFNLAFAKVGCIPLLS